ncbi:peptidoglycan-binding protein [Streptomyces sp. NBC_01571]|uniref:peptidoglycan-binding domain-containing protein n=1 Tax=Streptomyces sp. NBC_01571 TaxID=2975883 RepID=UPI0022533E1D|nr:peptidoglycan-binding domain-containing protein [Streptomyces sp. NBC_01571]MCX4572646.1 peptidoglycan-binding protein [Streptomyces sp. NBC_01571]
MNLSGGVGRRAAVSAAVCSVVFAATCAASAPPTDHATYVIGSGAFSDDWSEEPLLEVGRVPRSDLVGLWQAILWADGYLPGSGITCSFDAATSRATQTWQTNHGLGVDGIVGAVTFGFAARRLVSVPPWTAYRGERYTLPLLRGRGGVYEVYDAGRFHGLRTNEVTLASCRR